LRAESDRDDGWVASEYCYGNENGWRDDPKASDVMLADLTVLFLLGPRELGFPDGAGLL
jgi:hypothetical protein